ncbi:GIY-YIG nuclease family protein [Streptomyces cellulosae]
MPVDPGHWADVAQAFRTTSWTSLGYVTWGDYIAGEWEIPPIPSAERRDIALYLTSRGLPLKAVATALRVSYETVRTDLVGRRKRQRARAPQERFVYLIGSEDFRPVKIGTGNPARRVSEFQTGNPFPLVVLWQMPGDERLEQLLHARFEPFRVTGEWFDFPDDMDPVTTVSRAAKRLSAGLVAAS